MESIDFDTIRNYCHSQKSSVEDTPFGPEALVFKVSGKMFALLSFKEDTLYINLKNAPEINIELRESHPFISPGFHMNKKHWNTIAIKEFYDKEFLFSMINQSYNLVVASLPKKVKNDLLTH